MGEDKDIVEEVQHEAEGRTDRGTQPRPDPDETSVAGAASPEAPVEG